MQEILFVRNLLEAIAIQAMILALLFMDNVGAVFIEKNASTKGRTKHRDIHYHVVRGHIEDSVIVTKFVRGEDNTANILTKNTSRATFDKHARRFVCNESGELSK